MTYITTNANDVSGLALVKVDKNGTKYCIDYTCPKCSGTGYLPEYDHIDGGICYLCGGTGQYETNVIYRTPEYQEKLNAAARARERRNANKLNAKYFADNGLNAAGAAWIIYGNTYKIKDELKAAGARYTPALGWHFDALPVDYPAFEFSIIDYLDYNENGRITGFDGAAVSELIKDKRRAYELKQAPPSDYQGVIGERIELELICTGAVIIEGYYSGVDFINFLSDVAGNAYVWKTGRRLPTGAIKLRGTIKDHKEYKGQRQTILTRCKVIS